MDAGGRTGEGLRGRRARPIRTAPRREGSSRLRLQRDAPTYLRTHLSADPLIFGPAYLRVDCLSLRLRPASIRRAAGQRACARPASTSACH